MRKQHWMSVDWRMVVPMYFGSYCCGITPTFRVVASAQHPRPPITTTINDNRMRQQQTTTANQTNQQINRHMHRTISNRQKRRWNMKRKPVQLLIDSYFVIAPTSYSYSELFLYLPWMWPRRPWVSTSNISNDAFEPWLKCVWLLIGWLYQVYFSDTVDCNPL